MEPRPIPIEELKPGDFYDIQSCDESPRVLGALLLEQLPNNRARLLFLNSSDFDRFTSLDTGVVLEPRALQIKAIQLGVVYPFHTFTDLPNQILQWPYNYKDEELVTQIQQEMDRIVRNLYEVSKNRSIFNLPHFCGGYLQLYLSYLRKQYPEIADTLYRTWYMFIEFFFSVLRDHILHIKLVPTDHISDMLKAIKDIDQLSDLTVNLNLFPEREKTLIDKKKSFFDSYRPTELSSNTFDGLWELISQKYHEDLIIWQLQEPLSLWDLFLHPTELIGILCGNLALARDLMDMYFPESQFEENLSLQSKFGAAADLFRQAEYLVEQPGISREELSRLILEKELITPILMSRRRKLQDFVMTRAELFPSVLANLENIPQGNIQFTSIVKCATARIAVEDWQFITSLIEHQSLDFLTIRNQRSIDEAKSQIRELVEVSLKHQMKTELLKGLLPCEDYGHLVFPVLVERFSLPHSREVMLSYFTPEQWHNARLNSRTDDRIFSFFKELTLQIALENWECVTFLTQHDLKPADHRMFDNHHTKKTVSELLDVALEHKMNPELLRSLLPYQNYGHLVLPVLVSFLSNPHSIYVLITYCRPEQWRSYIKDSKAPDILLVFLRGLTARITLEDWEFVQKIIIEKFLVSPIPLPTVEFYQSVKELVDASIEHHMKGDLLRNLLPTQIYGFLAFPAFVEGFLLTRSAQLMMDYFGTEQQSFEFARNMRKFVFETRLRSPCMKNNKRQTMSQYLMKKKLNVWYVFGGSVQIQFMWMRQFSPGFLKRLSLSLAREVCSYLV